MSGYRRGTVLGLTVAETFILLTFLLLLALLGLTQRDELLPESEKESVPREWVRPEEIETLKNMADEAREAMEEAERARAAAEHERDKAHQMAAQARRAQEKAEQARTAAERERDKAHETAEQAREAKEKAEQARAAAERERDKAHETAEQARRVLAKGRNPPCWYDIVPDGKGGTRERALYAFNVAIYEDSIELAQCEAPPGGAFDDGGGPYADEYDRLRIEELPYGRGLNDKEFEEAVRDLVEQGKKQQVRTYECVFFVRVWDKTPDHAKGRWKYAHDRIIEGSFGAFTVGNREWPEC